MLKTSTLVPAFVLFLFVCFFASCQKEVNFGPDFTARFSFDGGTGSCAGATVSGTYTAGTQVTTDNKVILNVVVDSAGPYAISTGAVNGLSFSGAGVFASKGAQTITLQAVGTPTVAGTYNFTPVANGCTFSVTVAGNSGGFGGTATYSFTGGTGSCTDALVSGTLTAGQAATSANTVKLKLTVNTTGTYTISTNTVNGIKFSGSGSFTNTGGQTVTLIASGTPAVAGSFSFIPGVNGCSFNVTVNGAGGGGGGQGGGSGNFLKCKIDGVLSNFNTALVGYYVTPPSAGIPYSISVQGKKSDVANSPIEMWVVVSTPGTPAIGTYNNHTFSMGMLDPACQVSWFPTGFPNPYWGSSVFDDNTMKVNITSVTTAGATGTFSGVLKEGNGMGPGVKQVTEGAFKITF